MLKHCSEYEAIQRIPSFYTIHNGAYNSRYPWSRRGLLPDFSDDMNGMIEWDHHIDGMASALRFSDHVNTVSPSYLEEMKGDVPSLMNFLGKEPKRFSGILNGIDTDDWNPREDARLNYTLKKSWDEFKKKNKAGILDSLYRLDGIPLISFIGRFAYQKGADLLPAAMERILNRFGFVNFFVLA